jgi:hypothetical protein
MNSTILKTAALCWLRFGKQMPYVATEVGGFSADVLGANEKMICEVEVKVSKSDLRRDFVKEKHGLYKLDSGRPGWKPNYFYFIVPESLYQEAVKLAEEHNSKIGILSFRESASLWGQHITDRITVMKKASRLHKTPPSPFLLQQIAKRMASDLCTLYINLAFREDPLKQALARMLETTQALSKIEDLNAEEPEPANEP